MLNLRLLVLVLMMAACWGCKKQEHEYDGLNCASVPWTYSKDIRPLVDRSCALSGCHDASSPNGNYTSYQGLKTRIDNGRLPQRVLYTKDMPPSGPLPLSERQKIKCWIDNGAPEN